MQSVPPLGGPAQARHIAEDTLHYTLHLPPSTTLPAASVATLITAHVHSLLPGGERWQWHKDGWQLYVRPTHDPQDRRKRFGVVVQKRTLPDPSHPDSGDEDEDEDEDQETGTSDEPREEAGATLEGRMRIGDAVDDEWLVVWLLRSISRSWPDVMISIRDTDGEFLLIEAADHLPRWLTPDNAENRFWLVNGHFHLIPPTYTSATARPKPFIEDEGAPERDDAAWISERDAVRLLRGRAPVGESEDTKGPFWVGETLEADILRRIDGYPAALSTHHQHTLAYLPVNIAKALRADPALIQRAVEGFYMRDPAQLRAAARTTRFPPAPETSVVLAPVTMTRVAYAQLKGQVFHPPRTFGNEWRVVEAAGEEVAEEERVRRAREKRWRDLGVKVVMGFEIMYREDNKRSKGAGEDSIDEKDPAFEKYLDNLKRAGFFGENMEGSEDWRRRMDEAKRGWIRVNDSGTRTSFADAVDAALKATMDLDGAQLAAPATYTEDSEAWLEVSPDELDGLLSRSGGPRDGEGEDAEAQAQAEGLSVLAKKVGQFVEGKGDLEGARFEDEASDDNEDDFMVDSDDESDVERSMQVDPVMTEEQKRDRLQALVPGIKPEEWGRQTQDLTALTSATEKKAVSFAQGTKGAEAATGKEAEDAALEKARRSRFEPTDYEGHLVESGDETDDDEDGEQSMPSWTTHKPPPGRSSKRRAIDPTIYQLSEALKTGKVGPIEGWKDRSEAEDLEMSDDEDEVVEGDIDMDQEEEEFLKFAREALGIDEAMWTGMLEERKSRGAYIPGDRDIGASGSSNPEPPKRARQPKPAEPVAAPRPAPRVDANGRNPDLDSFEKVMEAMEAELARAKSQSGSTQPPKTSQPAAAPPPARSSATANPLPPLPTAADLDAMDEDDLIAMDRELRAALKNAGISDDEDFSDEDMDDETREGLQGLTEESRGEFKMMKDFLESYKAQGGQSGVVGNLFGRLGGKQ